MSSTTKQTDQRVKAHIQIKQSAQWVLVAIHHGWSKIGEPLIFLLNSLPGVPVPTQIPIEVIPKIPFEVIAPCYNRVPAQTSIGSNPNLQSVPISRNQHVLLAR